MIPPGGLPTLGVAASAKQKVLREAVVNLYEEVNFQALKDKPKTGAGRSKNSKVCTPTEAVEMEY